MIQDCKADKPEGWTHFIAQYLSLIQALIRHYYPSRSADADLVNSVLLALWKSEPGFFSVCEPLPEREFVAELRQFVLAAVEEDSPTAMAEISLELDTLSAALEPFTSTEKQVVWLETMRYDPEQTAAMMHMHAATVEKT
jgi:DNA-directed RNA polymerase specialized sigma24 family protein